jgi:hypothetical protein
MSRKRLFFLILSGLILPLGAGSAFSQVMPREQAVHFCQLLVNDGERIQPLRAHALRIIEPSDTITQEQLFADFVLRDGNWQTLRIFPHQTSESVVEWFAPAEQLPAVIGAEHQKYIREVFPRLISEVKAGNWQTVDAYIDRMIQYQCTFGKLQKKSAPAVSSTVGALVCILILMIVIASLTWRKLLNASRG